MGRGIHFICICFCIKLQKQTEKEDAVSLSDVEDFSDEGSTSEKLVETERRHCVAVYESLVEKTRDIPLEKVKEMCKIDEVIYYCIELMQKDFEKML